MVGNGNECMDTASSRVGYSLDVPLGACNDLSIPLGSVIFTSWTFLSFKPFNILESQVIHEDILSRINGFRIMVSKKTILFCFSMVLAVFVIFPSNVGAIIEAKPELQQDALYWDYISFGETQAVPFTVKTTGNVSIWFLTPVEFSPLLPDNGSLITPSGAANLNSIDDGTLSNGVYTIEQQWTVAFLNITYGLPITEKQGADGKNSSVVNLYIVIQNHGPGTLNVMIQLKPISEFLNHLSISTKWMMIFIMFALVVWLLWNGRTSAKSEERKHKANMYYGFGIGFGFGLAARIVGEFTHYYDRDVGLYLFPQDRLQGSIASVLFGSKASTAIPSVIFLIMLSLAFVGFSYIVEKIVKNRKPFFTVNLIVAAAVAPLTLVIPEVTDIIIIYIIASIGLAIVNVMIVYITVAKSTSGALRRQAIFTLVGVILPVVFQVFDGLITFGAIMNAADIKAIVLNSLVVFGLLLFYKSKV